MMEDKVMHDVMTSLEHSGVHNDGDYVGDGGVLYCGKCHTPKEIRVDLFGRERVLPMLCQCEARRRDEEEAAWKEREFARRVERLRRACFAERGQSEHTFAADDRDDVRLSNAMRTYVDKWDEVRAKNMGLLLYGPPGTGKSFYAACIANALIDKGVSVVMTSFARIVGDLQGLREDNGDYIDHLARVGLLVIDDLGAERDSKYMQEQVYAVINARYEARKPLILTTNLPIEQIKSPGDLNYRRIYDRVLEMCHPVKFEGRSKRVAHVIDNFEERNKLLGL